MSCPTLYLTLTLVQCPCSWSVFFFFGLGGELGGNITWAGKCPKCTHERTPLPRDISLQCRRHTVMSALEIKERRKEREGWIEQWVNECSHSRSFLTSEVTPNPGESSYGVSHVCNLPVSLRDHTPTHAHTHRNEVTKTSICQVNNPWWIEPPFFRMSTYF